MKLPTTLLTCACLCVAASAGAAEWSATPVLSWTVDHDSNRLLIDNGQSSEGAYLQLDLLLKRATGKTVFSLRPNLGWQQYTNRAAQNSNNQSLQAAGTWISDRSVLSTQVAVTRDNSLNNELPQSGILTGSTERRSKVAALSWRREQSERDQLQAQLGYSDIEYRNERIYTLFGYAFPFRTLYGYRYPTVSITQTHQWSSRNAMQFSAYAGRLMSQGYSRDSDSFGAQLGFNRALTSRINLFFSAGLSRQTDGNRSNDGYIGRLELTRTDELGKWRLFAERSISASGLGYLVTRNEAGVSFDRRLTPRWSASLSLRGIRNNDVASGLSSERDYYARAEAGLGWQATRTWTVGATASLARARQVAGSPVVQGLSATVAATWAPLPRMVSR